MPPVKTVDFHRERLRMVGIQLVARGISDERVLAAMREVPREEFVDGGSEEFAYEDGPLPIPVGQTISQPYIVALMAEAGELRSTDRLLEVGAGSGYALAVMSRIVSRAYGIDRHATLVEGAQRRLRKLGYDNVEVRVGDGTRGWPEAAPFDAIIVSAGGPEVPEALKAQLALGGRLVMPVGNQPFRQTLRKLTRRGLEEYDSADLCDVAFVPLIGAQGWDEDGGRRLKLDYL
jgi:protein-L-isoaspartate(D-aspartate) O-methyltransferase